MMQMEICVWMSIMMQKEIIWRRELTACGKAQYFIVELINAYSVSRCRAYILIDALSSQKIVLKKYYTHTQRINKKYYKTWHFHSFSIKEL